VPPYIFPNRGEFLDRQAELGRLRQWWADEHDRFPLVLYGRRRTGKTWLLRQFAHGKSADIFVCDTRAQGDQLAYFARALGASLGFRPELPDVRSFYDVLLRPTERERRLVVIDEFPLLLQVSRGAASSLAAALEQSNRDSLVKLVLCGSQIATMQGLLAERAPLHGRGTRLLMTPMSFRDALHFLAPHRADDAITRYSIAGGMPLYLRRLGREGNLKKIVCEDVLSPLAPFFDEVREVLAMELTRTAIYFSLLAALAAAPSLAWEDLVRQSRVEEPVASKYIRALEDLRIVEAANPLFAPPNARRRRYRVADAFVRFWFRFVFPHQPDLMAGLRPEDHWDRNVAPHLAEHTASVFERVCQEWVRARFRDGTDTVGSWWGLARHDLRRTGARATEEIDVVGARGRVATVIGECRWQKQPMGRQVIADLLDLKIPALAQVGVDTSSAHLVLFSRGGFQRDLVKEAAVAGRDIELVGLDAVVA
jgi:AAA+ ATPase superfamily predicted ATPase